MPMVFINLPVADLEASRAFYTALDLRIHEQFSDDRTLVVVVGDEVALMLHLPASFAEFGIAAGQGGGVQAVHCITVDSREDVDRLVAAGITAGGSAGVPVREDGLRYIGSVLDPDGHAWEFMLMGQQHVVN